MSFSGSYKKSDASFLLDPIVVERGEARIEHAAQIAAHAPISAEYHRLFLAAIARNQHKLARDVAAAARYLAQTHAGEIVLASLVCAGTPLAVLIHRALTRMGRRSYHYAISTVRDRGIDFKALDHITARHRAQEVVFIDGWTGKGFIASELRQSVQEYNRLRHQSLDATMVVLADLAGAAAFAGSSEDYLIPSAMLRSTVNGLTGPSFVNPNPHGNFDACLYLAVLAEHDASTLFVDAMMPALESALKSNEAGGVATDTALESERFVEHVVKAYGLAARNWVKPGVSEATRALLTRKVPMTLLVRNPQDPDVSHLFLLAQRQDCQIVVDSETAYRASVLLRA
jgi:hypothetical protein